MALQSSVQIKGFELNEAESRRVLHQLEALERRLVHRPEPSAVLVLKRHAGQRAIEASLRVELGPLGPHLVSHQRAETADHATRLAVEDVERQLERQIAAQRGEPSFGVPSRREPKQERPHPPGRSESSEPEE